MILPELPGFSCQPILGYIGPGAGFAFLGSFLILFTAVALALLSLLFLPVRLVVNAARRWRRRGGAARARRVVILGMDGLDPAQLRGFIASGDAPNFKALAEGGTFADLQSTCPPMSPVAWSSFATGVNPGKHNIFDFLGRNLKSLLPEMSSCRIGGGAAPEVTLLRKSKPFWNVLGEHGVFSTVLRVPITFPPEKFDGLMLSGMCVPDLRGTQGAFTFFTSADPGAAARSSEGMTIAVKPQGRRIETALPGPTIDGKVLQCRLVIELDRRGKRASLRACGQKVRLDAGRYSDWVRLTFRTGISSRIHGICRFLLTSVEPHFGLYATPINMDPEHPAMPVSHPAYYSVYLSKLHGPFATLGLAEDTWALTEGVIDDKAFLEQTYDIHAERRAMFFDALKRTRTGVCCCVFDLPDRIQHMFFRYSDKQHPAARGRLDPAAPDPVMAAYREMDDLLGRTVAALKNTDVMIVMSDHGFASFRRNVNVNRWLEQEGFLVTRKDAARRDYLADVDWEKTRAYSFGLSGIYVNLKGREARGIVGETERQAIKDDIAARLSALKDPQTGEPVVKAVHDSGKVYSGPYKDNGPDLVVGYRRGYRVSWETSKGQVAGDVFSDNTRPWSGDHCIDASLVPGVLLSNRRLDLPPGGASIMDIAPTVLDLFGVPRPGYMDGRILGVMKDNPA